MERGHLRVVGGNKSSFIESVTLQIPDKHDRRYTTVLLRASRDRPLFSLVAHNQEVGIAPRSNIIATITEVLAGGGTAEVSIKGQKDGDSITVIYSGPHQDNPGSFLLDSETYRFSVDVGWKKIRSALLIPSLE
ncbi:hypothetical protein HYS91_02590 [Candidatus Daviesbacteria bacterium]|nr:hypothetical protein [Candidatus Daviesbacteria bacterium]